MIKQWNVPAIWILGGLLLVVLAGTIFLASTNNFGSFSAEPAAAVLDGAAVDFVEIEQQENPAPSGAVAGPDGELAAEETVGEQATSLETNVQKNAPSRPQPAVLNGDTRPAQLRALTTGWNTNWERRTIEYDEVLSGGPPRDGIPSIDAPQFVNFEAAAPWLADNEPVIALEIAGDARAYPLQVLTWHEIANDTVGGVPVVVTFCPLCNSALVFDRRVGNELYEFGVSGLLRNSDLIMYDRTTESLWQQFTGEGIVGDHAGNQLTFLASSLVSFADFREAFPEGQVLSRETGFSRSYGRNPYEGYDSIGSDPFLFRGPIDGRLAAVERVVTVSQPDQAIDIAYPLSVLSAAGVINDSQGGQDLVVFFASGTNSALGSGVIADAEDVGATGVFDPMVDGQKLTFQKEGDQIVDVETGSAWNVLGQAIDGELAGESLEAIVHGDHFWFSWAAFRPDTIIYEPLQ